MKTSTPNKTYLFLLRLFVLSEHVFDVTANSDNKGYRLREQCGLPKAV
jgi:hypothetical protein